ncbi:extracellular solute-binding protein [Duganella sp. FT92W]|uniref:Extracellular solute-binding protein n=2 Tax=Pseudoduganella rivuli TaxID=2666085 RepID=A0A7X2IRW7_9BURK|nr:extracellular solute-binding protein [Pseudoduganella rivuli]
MNWPAAAAFQVNSARLMALGLLVLLSGCEARNNVGPAKTEITLMRFFGSCDGQYAHVNEVAKGQGECGIITTLVNEFNATNSDGIVVRTEVVEWGPYYDQLIARIVAKDVPTVAVMHESALGDYVRRNLVLPLDKDFAAAGIATSDFTAHARRGVTIAGGTYALPFDSWSWLWHVNTSLMKQAGLLDPAGRPLVPGSPQELLAHARQFRRATGKPYFAWATANEPASNTRTFLTLVAQQNALVFGENGKSINMHQPAVDNALTLMQQLYAEGHVKPNLNYAGANQAFLRGDAGVIVVGTWAIDQFLNESGLASSPLYGSYTIFPFPQLYQRKAVFADGHSWVMLKAGSPDEKTHQAGVKLLKFIWDHSSQWARSGNLPARQSVVTSENFRKLPFRDSLAEITHTGIAIPSNVPTQRLVEFEIGAGVGNLLVSGRPLGEVQDAVETRVNRLLKKARR